MTSERLLMHGGSKLHASLSGFVKCHQNISIKASTPVQPNVKSSIAVLTEVLHQTLARSSHRHPACTDLQITPKKIEKKNVTLETEPLPHFNL